MATDSSLILFGLFVFGPIFDLVMGVRSFPDLQSAWDLHTDYPSIVDLSQLQAANKCAVNGSPLSHVAVQDVIAHWNRDGRGGYIQCHSLLPFLKSPFSIAPDHTHPASVPYSATDLEIWIQSLMIMSNTFDKKLMNETIRFVNNISPNLPIIFLPRCDSTMSTLKSSRVLFQQAGVLSGKDPLSSLSFVQLLTRCIPAACQFSQTQINDNSYPIDLLPEIPTQDSKHCYRWNIKYVLAHIIGSEKTQTKDSSQIHFLSLLGCRVNEITKELLPSGWNPLPQKSTNTPDEDFLTSDPTLWSMIAESIRSWVAQLLLLLAESSSMNDPVHLESMVLVSELTPQIPLILVSLSNGTTVKTSLQLFIESAVYLYHSDPTAINKHHNLIDRLDYAIGKTLLGDPDDPASRSVIIAWLYATLQAMAISIDHGLSGEEQIGYILSLTPAHLLEQLYTRTIESIASRPPSMYCLLRHILLQMEFVGRGQSEKSFFADLSISSMNLLLDEMLQAWNELSTQAPYPWLSDAAFTKQAIINISLKLVDVPGCVHDDDMLDSIQTPDASDMISEVCRSAWLSGPPTAVDTDRAKHSRLAARLLIKFMTRFDVQISVGSDRDLIGLEAFLVNVLEELNNGAIVEISPDLNPSSRCTILLEQLLTAALSPPSFGNDLQQGLLGDNLLLLIVSVAPSLFPAGLHGISGDIHQRCLISFLRHPLLAWQPCQWLQERVVAFIGLFLEALFDPGDDAMPLKPFLDTLQRNSYLITDFNILNMLLSTESIHAIALNEFSAIDKKLIVHEIATKGSKEQNAALELLLTEHAEHEQNQVISMDLMKEICSICLYPFYSGDEGSSIGVQNVFSLRCGHVFHESCTQGLLMANSRPMCPLCRAPFDPPYSHMLQEFLALQTD